MFEPLAGFLGFFSAMLVVRFTFNWYAALGQVWQEYREAVTYPHLNRKQSLWVFLPLTILNSGPWILGLAAFGFFKLFAGLHQAWHSWFIGGFVVYLLMAASLLASVRKRQFAREKALRAGAMQPDPSRTEH